MKTQAALIVFGLLFLSGCLEDGSGIRTGTDASRGPSTPSKGPPTGPAGSGPASRPVPEPQPPVPVQQTRQDPWPELGAATIRPGVQTHDPDGNQCTTNFLFRSPDNATLYLGIAAHCVNGMKVGDPVRLQGASANAKLAYSSWIAQGVTDCIGAGNTMKDDQKCNNDFSLIAIGAKDRLKVHPAVLHFGGPTALGNSTTLDVGDRVLGYGNSGAWPSRGEVHWHEGIVTADQGTYAQFYIMTIAPGIPGDSGSAVLTRDGQAVGLLSTLCYAPCTGQNGVVGLAGQLAMAKTHGTDVQLVTWAAMDDGIVP